MAQNNTNNAEKIEILKQEYQAKLADLQTDLEKSESKQ
jgi:hypothetical protein